jgi:D-lactate dehydrogenase (cytochrome)
VPFGGVVVSLERLNAIGPVESFGNGKAYLTAGAAARLADIKEKAAAAGYMYAPDPTEQTATIGGTIATNASGSRGFKFGSTRNYVNSLRVAMADGELLVLKRGKYKAKPDNTLQLPSVSGKLITVTLPGYNLPQIKNAAGYFNDNGMDAIDLFIGQEGTLGVITQAQLSLLPFVDAAFSGVAFFKSKEESWRFARHARELSKAARLAGSRDAVNAMTLEYFDRSALDILKDDYQDIPAFAGAAIFFEQDCDDQHLDPVISLWQSLLNQHEVSLDNVWFAMTEKSRGQFREFRHRLPERINELVTQNGLPKVGTDLAVPETHFKEMMKAYESVLGATKIPYLIFGHIGECHMHANILPRNQNEFDTARHAYIELVKRALAFGGTVSAEHGIGKTKHIFLEQMLGKHGISELIRVKSTLDPAWILNSGNMFPKP